MPFFNRWKLDWESNFVDVVRKTRGVDTLEFDAAVTLILEAPGTFLLEFDARARNNWHTLPDAHMRSRSKLETAALEARLTDVFLFHHACNYNGHLRENALRVLHQHPGRLACAVALIRVEDWVPQVAKVAHMLLVKIAASDLAEHFFEFLDLIHALRRKHRFSFAWNMIEHALLDPRWRAARARALAHPNRTTRLFALELVLRADPDLATQTLKAAVRDRSPHVALWASVTASRTLEADILGDLLREALQNRIAVVRADALRRYIRLAPEDGHETLVNALFDPAHAVRAAAAHQLSTLGERALDHWRAAFDAGRHRAVLIDALALNGDALDADRLRSQLAHPKTRLRATALRGLLRIGAPDTARLLLDAIRDPSPAIVAVAIAGYRFSNEQLDRAVLWDALTAAREPRLRTRLIRAARLLPKWEQLALLLERSLQARTDERDALEQAFIRWINRANSRYTLATEDQRREIGASLDELRREAPGRIWDRIAVLC